MADHFTIAVSDEQLADAMRAPRPEFTLTPLQVARILGVERQTVYRYVKLKLLTAVRPVGVGPGRQIRIPATEVRDMLARRD